MIEDKLSLLFVEKGRECEQLLAPFLKRDLFGQIYFAHSREEALGQLVIHKPDVVLIDLQATKIDGVELACDIKAYNYSTSVVLILSEFEKEMIEDAESTGIDAYIFKPISLERLNKILLRESRHLLEKQIFLKERKLLEEYKSALDVIAPVSKTDAKGVITYVNDSFCAMSGYTKEELLGNRHTLLRHSETPRELYMEMWGAIRAKKVWKGRLKNLKLF